jgi:hypothetical protein
MSLLWRLILPESITLQDGRRRKLSVTSAFDNEYINPCSTGWFTKEKLTFLRCTILEGGTATGMALYVFRGARLDIHDLPVHL